MASRHKLATQSSEAFAVGLAELTTDGAAHLLSLGVRAHVNYQRNYNFVIGLGQRATTNAICGFLQR